jgi:hypothetical protein
MPENRRTYRKLTSDAGDRKGRPYIHRRKCGGNSRGVEDAAPYAPYLSSPPSLGVDPARGPKPPYGGAHKRGSQRGNIAIPLWRTFFHGRHDFFPTRERNGVAIPLTHDIYPVNFRFTVIFNFPLCFFRILPSPPAAAARNPPRLPRPATGSVPCLRRRLCRSEGSAPHSRNSPAPLRPLPRLPL